MAANAMVRPVIIGLAIYYVIMTAVELVLAATHVHTLHAADGTPLFEATIPHAGIHVLMSIGLVVCAVCWQAWGRPALWVLGAILAGTSLLSLVNPAFAGEGLGHATMPTGYLVVNGAAAAVALMAAWATAPAKILRAS